MEGGVAAGQIIRYKAYLVAAGLLKAKPDAIVAVHRFLVNQPAVLHP